MARSGEGCKQGAWDGLQLGGVLEPEEGRGGRGGSALMPLAGRLLSQALHTGWKKLVRVCV